MIDTILLFDMDGVLLQPRGYHKALQETVRLAGQALGFEDPRLTQEDIYTFEAAGITSEWDSSALCLAWMLKEAWQHDPTIIPPKDISSPVTTHPAIPALDWEPLLETLSHISSENETVLQGVSTLLQKDLPLPKQDQIARIIHQAHNVQASLTHRTFQELVLGSRIFESRYPFSAQLDCPGTLQRYDQSNLSPQHVDRIKEWLGTKNKAAIFTNRPSQPPGELFSTPEAELGAEKVGLTELPIVGYGEMIWLAEKWNRPVDDFRKPSPVHTLAALLEAAGVPKRTALQESANLVLKQSVPTSWQNLSGVNVFVFEDTTAGLQSALSAKAVLDASGIDLKMVGIGITDDGGKRAALEEYGARVYPDLAQGLRDQFTWF
ncbi:MAG: hypothetical protein R6U57_01995 [Anaerolineales bacterium]